MSRKSAAERDGRLANRASTENREDRESQDRPVIEDREISDAVRLEDFRRSFSQSSLPDIPPIPGHHVCWLTTANPKDSIPSRQRMGYVLIKFSEIPGFGDDSFKSSSIEGCIGINEMVAAKLPDRLYEMYMNEAHHVQPQLEEDKLNAVVETIAENARKKGARVEAGDGTASLGKGPSRGTFEGMSS